MGFNGCFLFFFFGFLVGFYGFYMVLPSLFHGVLKWWFLCFYYFLFCSCFSRDSTGFGFSGLFIGLGV